MSLPTVGKQDALHVRMSIKLDTEHIVDFALQPVGSRPDGDGTGDAFAIPNLRFDANALVARERIKYPQDVELVFALGIVDRGNVHAKIKLLFVTQNLENFRDEGTI